jgi:hypothetical protein
MFRSNDKEIASLVYILVNYFLNFYNYFLIIYHLILRPIPFQF